MTVAEVAKAFTEALRKQDYDTANAFWAEDVVSVEAMDGPMKEVRGRAAVAAKGTWWFDNHEVHAFDAQGPFVNGDAFTLVFKMDVTQKASGQRLQMEEVALYTVKDGAIVGERFFM